MEYNIHHTMWQPRHHQHLHKRPTARRFLTVKFFVALVLIITVHTTTVKASTLGSQCQHDMDCTDFIKGSSCSALGYCECAPYYVQYNTTSCLSSQLLGGDCILNEQCTMKVANSSCLDGACRCVEGFLQFRKHTCLGPAPPGSVCYSHAHCQMFSDKTHCDFLIPNLFGRCQCTAPAKLKGGNCVDNTITEVEAHTTSTSTSTTTTTSTSSPSLITSAPIIVSEVSVHPSDHVTPETASETLVSPQKPVTPVESSTVQKPQQTLSVADPQIVEPQSQEVDEANNVSVEEQAWEDDKEINEASKSPTTVKTESPTTQQIPLTPAETPVHNANSQEDATQDTPMVVDDYPYKPDYEYNEESQEPEQHKEEEEHKEEALPEETSPEYSDVIDNTMNFDYEAAQEEMEQEEEQEKQEADNQKEHVEAEHNAIESIHEQVEQQQEEHDDKDMQENEAQLPEIVNEQQSSEQAVEQQSLEQQPLTAEEPAQPLAVDSDQSASEDISDATTNALMDEISHDVHEHKPVESEVVPTESTENESDNHEIEMPEGSQLIDEVITTQPDDAAAQELQETAEEEETEETEEEKILEDSNVSHKLQEEADAITNNLENAVEEKEKLENQQTSEDYTGGQIADASGEQESSQQQQQEDEVQQAVVAEEPAQEMAETTDEVPEAVDDSSPNEDHEHEETISEQHSEVFDHSNEAVVSQPDEVAAVVDEGEELEGDAEEEQQHSNVENSVEGEELESTTVQYVDNASAELSDNEQHIEHVDTDKVELFHESEAPEEPIENNEEAETEVPELMDHRVHEDNVIQANEADANLATSFDQVQEAVLQQGLTQINSAKDEEHHETEIQEEPVEDNVDAGSQAFEVFNHQTQSNEEDSLNTEDFTQKPSNELEEEEEVVTVPNEDQLPVDEEEDQEDPLYHTELPSLVNDEDTSIPQSNEVEENNESNEPDVAAVSNDEHPVAEENYKNPDTKDDESVTDLINELPAIEEDHQSHEENEEPVSNDTLNELGSSIDNEEQSTKVPQDDLMSEPEGPNTTEDQPIEDDTPSESLPINPEETNTEASQVEVEDLGGSQVSADAQEEIPEQNPESITSGYPVPFEDETATHFDIEEQQQLMEKVNQEEEYTTDISVTEPQPMEEIENHNEIEKEEETHDHQLTEDDAAFSETLPQHSEEDDLNQFESESSDLEYSEQATDEPIEAEAVHHETFTELPINLQHIEETEDETVEHQTHTEYPLNLEHVDDVEKENDVNKLEETLVDANEVNAPEEKHEEDISSDVGHEEEDSVNTERDIAAEEGQSPVIQNEDQSNIQTQEEISHDATETESGIEDSLNIDRTDDVTQELPEDMQQLENEDNTANSKVQEAASDDLETELKEDDEPTTIIPQTADEDELSLNNQDFMVESTTVQDDIDQATKVVEFDNQENNDILATGNHESEIETATEGIENYAGLTEQPLFFEEHVEDAQQEHELEMPQNEVFEQNESIMDILNDLMKEDATVQPEYSPEDGSDMMSSHQQNQEDIPDLIAEDSNISEEKVISQQRPVDERTEPAIDPEDKLITFYPDMQEMKQHEEHQQQQHLDNDEAPQYVEHQPANTEASGDDKEASGDEKEASGDDNGQETSGDDNLHVPEEPPRTLSPMDLPFDMSNDDMYQPLELEADNLVVETTTVSGSIENNELTNEDAQTHEQPTTPGNIAELTTQTMLNLASRVTLMEPAAPVATTLKPLVSTQASDEEVTPEPQRIETPVSDSMLTTKPTTTEIRKRVELSLEAVSLGLSCSTDKQCQLADPNTMCNARGFCDCAANAYDQTQAAQCGAERTGCSPGTFQCRSSGVCISWFFVCDGRSDCNDASDEECTFNARRNQTCPEQAFRCGQSGRCISRAALCDGRKQCPHGEDELGCAALKSTDACPPHTFRCKSGECLPEYEYCNAIISCRDGSDEPPHLCGSRSVPNFFMQLLTAGGLMNKNIDPTAYCPHRCSNGRCRSTAIVCSGRDGCGDGTDEQTCSVCRCPAVPLDKPVLHVNDFLARHRPLSLW